MGAITGGGANPRLPSVLFYLPARRIS